MMSAHKHRNIANRSSRWTEVADVEVGLINGETHGCAVAEGHMELLEGLADYASWFYLHNWVWQPIQR